MGNVNNVPHGTVKGALLLTVNIVLLAHMGGISSLPFIL